MTERPLYRVLDPAGFFGDDDNLWEEGSEIYFDGVPNEQMEPLNQVAEEKLIDYITHLDDLAKVTAEKRGVPFVGRPRTLDGAIAIATQEMRDNVSIMGAKNKPTSIERAVPQETPETGRRGRGRPKKAA